MTRAADLVTEARSPPQKHHMTLSKNFYKAITCNLTLLILFKLFVFYYYFRENTFFFLEDFTFFVVMAVNWFSLIDL